MNKMFLLLFGGNGEGIPITVAPTLGAINVPDALQNAFYSANVSSSNTAGAAGRATSWSIAGAPAWLTIDNNGTISGTPTVAGSLSGITVTATNSFGSSVSAVFGFTVFAEVTEIPDAPINLTLTEGTYVSSSTPDAPTNLTLTEGTYVALPDAPANLTLTEGTY